MSRNLFLTFAATGLTATLALSLGGCKKPPPPVTGACCTPEGACSVTVQADCSGNWHQNGVCSPNPCPPPPPPPDVALETVAQDMKADARVQFAADLKLPEEKLDLAKAIVKLADALAKGDAKAMKPLLTRRAQGLLADLQNSGGWEEGTKQIEAVRVVLIRDGVDFGAIGSAKIPEAEVTGTIMSKLTELASTIPPEQQAAIMKAAQDAMVGLDPAALAKDPAKVAEFQTKVLEAMKAAGVSEELQQKLADLGKPAEAAPAEAAAPSSTGTGVLIALQDIHGAYVLGWAAEKVGDAWVFSNAPSTPDIRPRASLWDNVGPEAFQAMQLASLPNAPKSGDDDANRGGGSGGGGGGGGGGGEGAPPSAPSPSSPSPAPSMPNSPFGKHPHN
jgi:hypothetical protein